MHPEPSEADLDRPVRDALIAVDWDFPDKRGDDGIHGLLPYAAKFIPDIPKTLIAMLTNEGDLVMDPFAGSGTTLLEARSANRGFVGIDANAVAVATAGVKVRGLNSSEAGQIRAVVAILASTKSFRRGDTAWQPVVPNRERWYGDEVFERLCLIRATIVELLDGPALEAALLVFAHAASRASFQESESRYVSKPRDVNVDVMQAEIVDSLLRLVELTHVEQEHSSGTIILGDSRDPSHFEPWRDAVDLVVTSPPYPNAYDYHLYHRFRLFWLGHDPKSLRDVEIGSHLTNQGRDDPIGAYEEDIAKVLGNSASAMRSGAWAVWVVGDGLHKGEIYSTATELRRIGVAAGLDHMATIDRRLPSNRRSVNHAGRRLEVEQLVVFRKPSLRGSRNYRLHGYERELASRELHALGKERAEWAALSHRVSLGEGLTVETHQGRLEGVLTQTGTRKNSTYLGHGIHAYKGKFYPQLAKALMNISGVEIGQVVLDPFGGSGTVALESTVRGVDAVSIDINPLAIEIARAKTGLLHVPESAARRSLRAIIDFEHIKLGRYRGRRDSFAECTVEELESWFPGPVLDKLNWILGEGQDLIDRRMKSVLRVLVSDLVRQVSQQDPGDLRIRRRKQPIDDAPVFALLAARAGDLERQMDLYWRWARQDMPKPGKATLVQGAVQDPKTISGLAKADLVLSSPPYATALPYLDTDRLSIALVLGYDKGRRGELERELIGSREISKSENDAFQRLIHSDGATPLPLPATAFLARYSHRVDEDPSAGFRKSQGPQVLARYLLRMHETFENLRELLARDGAMWMILGDSKTQLGGSWMPIPTIDLCVAIAESTGFELVSRTPITVTREGVLHSRNSITDNDILGFRRI